jgi:hypothetical protein
LQQWTGTGELSVAYAAAKVDLYATWRQQQQQPAKHYMLCSMHAAAAFGLQQRLLSGHCCCTLSLLQRCCSARSNCVGLDPCGMHCCCPGYITAAAAYCWLLFFLSCRSGELTPDELSIALERLGWPDEKCSLEQVETLMARSVQDHYVWCCVFATFSCRCGWCGTARCC